uniref:Uncharacterized protein n=1 Tax=Heterorhabditis bacteriophora TaxID=37862 RepID=A0A1I7WHG6_HETBA
MCENSRKIPGADGLLRGHIRCESFTSAKIFNLNLRRKNKNARLQCLSIRRFSCFETTFNCRMSPALVCKFMISGHYLIFMGFSNKLYISAGRNLSKNVALKFGRKTEESKILEIMQHEKCCFLAFPKY